MKKGLVIWGLAIACLLSWAYAKAEGSKDPIKLTAPQIFLYVEGIVFNFATDRKEAIATLQKGIEGSLIPDGTYPSETQAWMDEDPVVEKAIFASPPSTECLRCMVRCCPLFKCRPACWAANCVASAAICPMPPP